MSHYLIAMLTGAMLGVIVLAAAMLNAVLPSVLAPLELHMVKDYSLFLSLQSFFCFSYPLY
jgi:hypothetical protein